MILSKKNRNDFEISEMSLDKSDDHHKMSLPKQNKSYFKHILRIIAEITAWMN